MVVRNGWLTLEGKVEWKFQSERAEQAVRRINGLKGASNLIEIKPRVAAGLVKQQIEGALKRNAEMDAKSITAPGPARSDVSLNQRNMSTSTMPSTDFPAKAPSR